jgi:hypothetical protein
MYVQRTLRAGEPEEGSQKASDQFNYMLTCVTGIGVKGVIIVFNIIHLLRIGSYTFDLLKYSI